MVLAFNGCCGWVCTPLALLSPWLAPPFRRRMRCACPPLTRFMRTIGCMLSGRWARVWTSGCAHLFVLPGWSARELQLLQCAACKAAALTSSASASSPVTVCQVLAAPAGHEQLEVLGELMRQSHASYSRCGLGSGASEVCERRVVMLLLHTCTFYHTQSALTGACCFAHRHPACHALPKTPADGTDRLVELVQQEQDAAAARGEEPPLFGAKITGGGCGGEQLASFTAAWAAAGAVCVLCSRARLARC